jgi:hypothetical protein
VLPCDSDEYTAGVVTQNPSLHNAFDAADNGTGVVNCHVTTIRMTVELMEDCGFKDLHEITVVGFFSKMNAIQTKSFNQIHGTDDKINTAKKLN